MITQTIIILQQQKGRREETIREKKLKIEAEKEDINNQSKMPINRIEMFITQLNDEIASETKIEKGYENELLKTKELIEKSKIDNKDQIEL